MSKMSKAIAVLGVVAGLGVAALPLSSYAAIGDTLTGPYAGSQAEAEVQVKVGGAISIATKVGTEGTADATAKTIDLGDLMPGGKVEADASKTLTVEVSSNDNKDASYGLYINGKNGVTDMIGQTNPTNKIATGTTIANGTSAWGYKLDAGTDYKAVPANATKVVDTTALNDANSHKDSHTFAFGVSASTDQAPDTYTSTVVFTAVLENV